MAAGRSTMLGAGRGGIMLWRDLHIHVEFTQDQRPGAWLWALEEQGRSGMWQGEIHFSMRGEVHVFASFP